MQPRTRLKLISLALPILLLACGKIPRRKPPRLPKMSTLHWERSAGSRPKKAQEILAIGKLSDATRDQARLKLEQAKSEQQAKLHFQRFSGAAGTDHDTAMAAFRDMAQGSYYRTLAKSEYDRILPSYVEDHLKKRAAPPSMVAAPMPSSSSSLSSTSIPRTPKPSSSAKALRQESRVAHFATRPSSVSLTMG